MVVIIDVVVVVVVVAVEAGTPNKDEAAVDCGCDDGVTAPTVLDDV